MKRIGLIGLAFTMVCAASAVVAASASAKPFEFRAEKYPVEVLGGGTASFEFGGVPVSAITRAESEVVCASSFATNEEGVPNPTKESRTLEVHPTYGKCGVTGADYEIRTTGCNYLLTAVKPGEKNGPIEIKCANGDAIEIALKKLGTGCVIKIGPQALVGIEYVNEAVPFEAVLVKRIHLNADVEKLKYTPTAACGLGIVEAENGTYRESSGSLEGFTPGTTQFDGIEVSR
jgi:hypothetical protein